jgi:AbrB family looped-hinge helix DNA binding protein
MSVEFTKLTSKGQLVIPARLRRKLGMKAGTRVAVHETGGQIILQPITDAYIDSMRGMLGDTTRMIEYLHEERRKENNEEVRFGRKRTAGLSRPAARRVASRRPA